MPETEENCLLNSFKTIRKNESRKSDSWEPERKERKPTPSKQKDSPHEKGDPISPIGWHPNGNTPSLEKTKEVVSLKHLQFKEDEGINMDIQEELILALQSCPNKQATITSGKRYSGYKRSLHRCGKAIDFHYDEDFIDWLLSEKGHTWLNEHHLEFFIEDNNRKSKKKLPERFQDLFRWIPWATGLHIHLNIKR